MRGLTPFQTVGPFFAVGLTGAGAEDMASESTAGRCVSIDGRVLDGGGQPVPDAVVEIWQADSSGDYPGALPDADSPSSRRGGFRGFGRSGTDMEGRFRFQTVLPGRVQGVTGLQAPHLLVGVLARGILTRLLTRIYFSDQPANDADDILQKVPHDRRATLIARRTGEDRYRFDIVLQGEGETVFFDV